MLTYLATSWGSGEMPRFPDELTLGYTRYLNSKGAVITWEVPVRRDGRIPQPFVESLRMLRV